MKVSYITVTSIILLFIFSACGISDSSEEEQKGPEFIDGVSEDVWELVSEEQLETIENELEMPIYRGDDPPIFPAATNKTQEKNDELIFDTYLAEPVVLKVSSVPNDPIPIESTMPNVYFRFQNQDPTDKTLSLSMYEEGLGTFTSQKAPIIGENGYFTIVSVLTGAYFGNEQIEGLIFISGFLGQEAIAELNYNIFMLDNSGDDDYIPNNTGRTFIDEWEISELTTWPEITENKSEISVMSMKSSQ